MLSIARLSILAAWSALVSAHTQITYPGERGNTLHTNGTLPQHDPSALSVNYVDGEYTFPWGMQWVYPCGGLPLTKNRTYWPYKGGAVSVQPGWFPGHSKALIYINMGVQGPNQDAPPNMSHPLVPPFQLLGPTNDEYAGQFCLPQVPMPVNLTLSPGDNVTLQVIEVAQHGAALYNCVDLTLTELHDERVKEVTPQNCYNSSDLSFELVFTSEALTSDAISLIPNPSLLPLLAGSIFTLFAAIL